MAIKTIKIMLDPGHDTAKYNKGAAPGYWEGAQMWKLYQFLRPALETRGFIVGGTKTKCDQEVDVVARGRMARGYDAFISLHSNACGTESVDRPVGIYFVDDDCGHVDGESKELAVLLSNAVAEVMGTSPAQQYSSKSSRDRDGDGKKDDDYYGVLYGSHQEGVPGIILEHSFHTNRNAAAWLMIDANLRRLAEAEADALADYYGLEAPAKEPEKWYRVRKSWADANSQLGAFLKLEHAKTACAAGYTVYDWNGVAVYSKPAKANQVKPDAAQSFATSKAGVYKIREASGLNLRAGASTDKPILEAMPDGSTVRCYGYYTGAWLYVVSESGKTGFCHSDYLVKV